MEYNVKAGDIVGIVRMGNYGYMTQGLYEVTKANKAIVEVTRQADGYVRTFSNRTGVEKGSTKYRSAEIVSKERIEAMDEKKRIENERAELFQMIGYAAQKKNLADIKVLVERLEGLAMSSNKMVA
jgi:hypothetical protein